jgi:hypothetical protein
MSLTLHICFELNWIPLIIGSSQLSLWIVFPLKLMATYYLNFLLFVIHWGIIDNCKVWTKSSMVMFGTSCTLVTKRNCLDWILEWQNALEICVVRMIFVLCLNVHLCTMKFLGVGIVCNFRYLGSVLWNPWFVPLAISSMILCPHVYKLAVAECIILFTSFQIFQEPRSTWAPMSI